MKYCGECATPIEPEDQFCPECGTRLSTFRIGKAACKRCDALLIRVGKKTRCPRCDSYCAECGSLVQKEPRKKSLSHDMVAGISWVEYGGLVPRGLATLADLIFVAAGVVLIGVIAGRRLPLFLLWVLILHMVYSVYFLAIKGSTPGMRIYSLRAVDPKGARIDFRRSFYRYFLSLGSLLSIGGCVMIGFHRHKQAMHDLMAETYVVRIRE